MTEKDIQIAYLTPNEFSRPRKAMRKVKGLVIHWIANPRTGALFNREYFELRKNGKHGYGSAHFIIGLGGEIVQCIPLTEVAYHVGADTYTPYAIHKFGNYPNNCTVGIELCHPDWTGRFTSETLNPAIDLCAGLSDQFDLEPLDDLTTHYAITEKLCPKWFVEHPDDFMQFKRDVHRKLVGRCT